MSTTVTPRLGVYQWTAGTDEYFREHLNDSFAGIETKLMGYIQGTTRPAASPSLRGFLFFQEVAHVFSYCDGTQWWDVIGGETFGSVSVLSITSTNTEGVSNLAARADHVHGLPAFGTALAVGLVNSDGAGTSPIRASHVHTLASGVITTPKLGTDSVGATALAALAVTSTKIASNAVTEDELGSLSVATANIADINVTSSKIVNGAAVGAKVGSVDASSFTSGVFSASQIPDLSGSKIVSGTFDPGVLPAEVPNTPSEWPIQTGEIVFYGGATAPAGYLLCDGSTVSRSTYSALNSLLNAAGYPYGSGDGSTTFTLPDLRGRMPVGRTGAGVGSTLGEKGGALDHTHAGPTHSHTIDYASTATNTSSNHSHTNAATSSTGSHTHDVGFTGFAAGNSSLTSGTAGLVARNFIEHSHSHAHTSGNYHSNTAAAGIPGGIDHSHGVSGTSGTSAPGYNPSTSAFDHKHDVGLTNSTGSHSHTVNSTGSDGDHSHSINVASFSSASSGAGTTGGANPPYIALNAIIKT